MKKELKKNPKQFEKLLILVAFVIAGMVFVYAKPGPIPSAAPIDNSSLVKGKYYVSQSIGNDTYDGLAPVFDGTHGPWKTLSKAGSRAYFAGDSIPLKCGDQWNKLFTLEGNGSSSSPITLASYASGDRPYIRGSGDNSGACITISASSQGWKIVGIETGYAKYGIKVLTSSKGDFYCFEDNYIHDCVNANWNNNSDEWGYGVIFVGASFTNIAVQNCIFVRNDCSFYHLRGSLENVIIKGCTFTKGHYNQLYQHDAKNFDILNCMFDHNGDGYINRGNTGVIMGDLRGEAGENEIAGNEFGWTIDPGGWDEAGYDFEVSGDGITLRNNFFHDCYGEAILFMDLGPTSTTGFTWNNLLIDNNLFVNNCNGSIHHKAEIDFWDGFHMNAGSGTISNNRFVRLPGVKMFSFIPSCFSYSNNVDVMTPLFTEPQFVLIDDKTNEFTLSCADLNASIYYSTDDSVPTQSSTHYTGGNISVTKSQIVNIKAFKDGYLPSVTNSQLIDLRAGTYRNK